MISIIEHLSSEAPKVAHANSEGVLVLPMLEIKRTLVLWASNSISSSGVLAALSSTLCPPLYHTRSEPTQLESHRGRAPLGLGPRSSRLSCRDDSAGDCSDSIY